MGHEHDDDMVDEGDDAVDSDDLLHLLSVSSSKSDDDGPADISKVIGNVTNQGIGPQQTNTKPPCYKGNKHRMRPLGFPTGLGLDGPQETCAVTL